MQGIGGSGPPYDMDRVLARRFEVAIHGNMQSFINRQTFAYELVSDAFSVRAGTYNTRIPKSNSELFPPLMSAYTR